MLLICRSGDQIQVDVALDRGVHDAMHRTIDAAAHHAVDGDLTVTRFLFRDGRDGERGLVDDAAADEQDLRQGEHDHDDGDDRAAAKALADARDDGLRCHAADQKAADREDRAGGDDRREGEVQRLDDGVAVVHFGFELLIAAGDDDGVVNVRAHLDGRNN